MLSSYALLTTICHKSSQAPVNIIQHYFIVIHVVLYVVMSQINKTNLRLSVLDAFSVCYLDYTCLNLDVLYQCPSARVTIVPMWLLFTFYH